MLSPRGRCVDPTAIPPDGLVAYALGEAGPAVAGHVERCPACGPTARRELRLHSLLRAALFRRSCPPSLTIGEYVTDTLAPLERQQIAGHLLDCPHCQAESRDFATFLAQPDQPAPDSGLLGALRRLIARPLANPAPVLAGLRATGDEENLTAYTAGGLRIMVGVSRHGGANVVVGWLEPAPEADAPATAFLYADDVPLQEEEVDELGNFLFMHVPAGAYRVEVRRGNTVIVIDPVRAP